MEQLQQSLAEALRVLEEERAARVRLEREIQEVRQNQGAEGGQGQGQAAPGGQLQAAAESNRVAFQRSLNSIPVYTGEGSFRSHLLDFKVWLNVKEITTAEQKKISLVYSLKKQAQERIRSLGPGTKEYDQAVTYESYERKIIDVFLPQSERDLSRIEFETYAQSSEEDVGSYLSTKYALYDMAYEGDEQNYDTLKRFTIQGIYNEAIRRLVIRERPTSKETLRKCILDAVASEQEAFQYNCAESTNVDGLSSIHRYTSMTMAKKKSREVDEAMEIGSLDTKKEGRAVTCYSCDRPGHYARDCRSAKNKGFNQRGTRNAGEKEEKGRKRETRRCLECNRIGHIRKDCFKLKKKSIQRIEEEEAEEDWVEDDYEVEEEEAVGAMRPIRSRQRQRHERVQEVHFLDNRRQGRRQN